MHCAGLIYDESFHYLDHLGPFCALLGWPLIASEPSVAEKARRYYPSLQVQETHVWDLSLSTVVTCEPRALIRASLNAPGLKTFWLPHGNSDKGWKSPFFEALEKGEPAFVYGKKMIDALAQKKVLAKTFSVGNFRWDYYEKNKSFYQKLMGELPLPKRGANFLYAPTWEDSENNSSLWKALPLLAHHLPDSCNLLVKLHPNTCRQHEVKLEQMMGQYAGRNNIIFLSDFPPIYPLLEVCHAYIGDMSSIGYDFLKFNRPMFFLNLHKKEAKIDPSAYLYRCGREIFPSAIPSLFSLPENTDFENLQKETYTYTFDSHIDLNKVMASCAALL